MNDTFIEEVIEYAANYKERGDEEDILEICYSPFTEEINRLSTIRVERELSRVERQMEELRHEFEMNYQMLSPLSQSPEYANEEQWPQSKQKDEWLDDPKPQYNLQPVEIERKRDYIPKFKYNTTNDPRLIMVKNINQSRGRKMRPPQCLNCNGKHMGSAESSNTVQKIAQVRNSYAVNSCLCNIDLFVLFL